MKLIFLIYDARSGSTLLAAMLSQLVGIKVMPETNFLAKMFVNGLDPQKGDVESVITLLVKETHFRELGINSEVLKSNLTKEDRYRSVVGITEAILESYFGDLSVDEDSYYLIKCGGAVFCMEKIRKHFPTGVFLHIVRDGRAVCASKMKSTSTWGRAINKSAVGNALHWRKIIRTVDKYDGNLIEVRYEDFVLDYKKITNVICHELGMGEQQRKTLTDISEYSSRIGNSQKQLHKNVGMPDRSIILKWKSVLSRNQVMVYEYIAKSALKAKGYELVVSRTNGVKERFRILFVLLCHYLYFVVAAFRNVFAFARENRLVERVKIKMSI